MRGIAIGALSLLSASLGAACTSPPDRDVTDVTADEPVCTDSSVTLDAGTCPILGRDEAACGTYFAVGYGRDGTFENYREYSAGDVVWITPGAQGLQHIVMGLRARGVDPTNPLVSLRLLSADASCHVFGFMRFRLPFSEDLNDHSLLELQAQRLILLDDANPLDYCGALDRDVVLVVDIDDAQGHRAHREYRLHVGGIDPDARPDQRQAWIDACNLDGGVRDGGLDANTDTGASE